MFDLQTLQDQNERRALAVVATEINGPQKAPQRVGKHYLWEIGDLVIISEVSTLSLERQPLLTVSFEGDKTGEQLFIARIKEGRKKVKSELVNRYHLSRLAGSVGVHGLAKFLDAAFGKE